jgi:hypothetical protein
VAVWPESIDLIRHSRLSTATLETSSYPAPGTEVNHSDFRPSTIAPLTNPRQHAGSQQPCCTPQQETQTSFVRPTSPPLPCLTLSGAFLSASAWTRSFTTSSCPCDAAACSGVSPFCGTRPRVSNPPLHPTRCTARVRPFDFKPPFSRNPHRAGAWRAVQVQGEGGVHSRYVGDSMRTPIADPTRGLFTTGKRAEPEGLPDVQPYWESLWQGVCCDRVDRGTKPRRAQSMGHIRKGPLGIKLELAGGGSPQPRGGQVWKSPSPVSCLKGRL